MSLRSSTTASTEGATHSRQTSSNRRVVTTPCKSLQHSLSPSSNADPAARSAFPLVAWARQLPPDEFGDDEEQLHYTFASASSAVPPRRASNPLRRSPSSIVRDSKSKQPSPTPSSSAGAADPPTSATPLQADNEHDGDATSPTPVAPVHSANDLRRGTLGADRWWTFTLPSKYLDKVHDYVSEHHGGAGSPTHEKGKERESREDSEREGEEGGGRKSDREERRRSRHEKVKSLDLEKQEYHRNMSMSMGTRLAPPNVFSINQTQVSSGASGAVASVRAD